MVNVTKSNFLSQSAALLEHLPSASFVAIDEEMTGISLPVPAGRWRPRLRKDEQPSERYANSLRKVPERYAVLQVGVALFHENPEYRRIQRVEGEGGEDDEASGKVGDGDGDGDEAEHADMHREGALNQDELEEVEEEVEEEIEEGRQQQRRSQDASQGSLPSVPVPRYTSRIYNFNLFPSGRGIGDRDVTMSPSAVKFLLEHGMDFDKVFREGVPYATIGRARYLREKFVQRHGGGGAGEGAAAAANGSRNDPTTPVAVPPVRKRVELTRAEDIAFVARTMAGLREWIDSDNSPERRADGDGDLFEETGGENGDGVGEGQHVAGGGGAENRGNNGVDGRREETDRSEGTSLILPSCNSFLRRCFYETIEAEYPGLVLEKTEEDPTAGIARNQIRVVRLTPEEKKQREARLLREEWDKLNLETIGFTRIFEALSDACKGKLPLAAVKENTAAEGGGKARKIPIVVHNGLMDLMFLLTHFHYDQLPDSFEDTKKLIREYFPTIFDTKLLSSEYSDAVVRGGSTTLGDLFKMVNVGADGWADGLGEILPKIVNCDLGNAGGQAHEASWDAYMTGSVFSALSHRILEVCTDGDDDGPSLDRLLHGKVIVDGGSSDGDDDGVIEKPENGRRAARERLGSNKIYFHQSIYTIDLESPLPEPAPGMHDPLSRGMSFDTTMHVSGIDGSVNTRDILQSLSSTGEGGDEDDDEEAAAIVRNCKFEIIWVNDVSFFVTTKVYDAVPASDDALGMAAIGLHVRSMLRDGLSEHVRVITLREYLARKSEEDRDGVRAGSEKREVNEAGDGYGSVVSFILAAVSGVFGRSKKRDREDGVSEHGSKRSRLS